MSNQDLPFGYTHLGVGTFDFNLNPLVDEFFSEIPSAEPLNTLLFNGFGLAGRSVITHSAMSQGLGRGRMPVLNPFFQMTHPFLESQPHIPFQLANPALRARAEPPSPNVRPPPPPLQPPQPAMGGRNRKRRASEKAISELKHLRLIDLKEDEDSCIICMETFVDIKSSTDQPKCENALKMPCGHIFGSHCLKLWLKDHSTCPTCRKEVDFVEEDERSDRTVGEVHRRRNAIMASTIGSRRRNAMVGEVAAVGRRRPVGRLAGAHGQVQHARDDIPPQHEVVEVGLFVQRQRITAPRLDPVAREHGVEDAGWVHTQSHYQPFVDMFSQGRDSMHELEEPMNHRPGQPALGRSRIPPVYQMHQMPPLLPIYHSNSGVDHIAVPPQLGFNSFTRAPQQQQSQTMPQRSQSQRQSQYFHPYQEVNMSGRGSVQSNAGPVDGVDFNDPPRIPRAPVPGCPRHILNAHNNPHSAPAHLQDPSRELRSHLQAMGTDMSLMSYLWEPNGQVHGQVHRQQQQQQHQQQLKQQQQSLEQHQQQLKQLQEQRQQIQQHRQHQLHQLAYESTYLDPRPENQLSSPSRTMHVDRHQNPAAAPHQHEQQQCAYTETGMCQHQYSAANNSGFAAGGVPISPPDMAQIVSLSCGHGFHRACLLSTKNRAPRTVSSAMWMCGICGKFEQEFGHMDGRQQAQHIAG